MIESRDLVRSAIRGGIIFLGIISGVVGFAVRDYYSETIGTVLVALGIVVLAVMAIVQFRSGEKHSWLPITIMAFFALMFVLQLAVT